MARYINISDKCASFNEVPNTMIIKTPWVSSSLLNNPRSMIVDENILYVTSEGNNSIIKIAGAKFHFRPSSSEIINWASSMAGSTLLISYLRNPWGISIDGEDMYVVNSGDNSIVKISNFRTQSSTTHQKWNVPNLSLNGPREIIIKDNDMYITNFFGNNITKITNFRNSPQAQIWSAASGLNRPYGMTFKDNIMFVSNANGKFITKIENEASSVFLNSNDLINTDPYGISIFENLLFIILGSYLMCFDLNMTYSLSTYLSSGLSSPIGILTTSERNMYITNPGTASTITKIVNFQNPSIYITGKIFDDYCDSWTFTLETYSGILETDTISFQIIKTVNNSVTDGLIANNRIGPLQTNKNYYFVRGNGETVARGDSFYCLVTIRRSSVIILRYRTPTVIAVNSGCL